MPEEPGKLLWRDWMEMRQKPILFPVLKPALSGGYSEVGTGAYEVEGENINITYDSNLAGGIIYKFTGYFTDKNDMKGSGIAYQVVSPEYPWQREFEWQARRNW